MAVATTLAEDNTGRERSHPRAATGAKVRRREKLAAGVVEPSSAGGTILGQES